MEDFFAEHRRGIRSVVCSWDVDGEGFDIHILWVTCIRRVTTNA